MGKINAYICEELHATVTEDIDNGTTPMFISCPVCAAASKMKMAVSRMYNVNQEAKATHEWYKPTQAELKEFLTDVHPMTHEGILEHVGKGGLLLRKKKEVSHG